MPDPSIAKRSKERAELEKIFGDDLPSTTRDERPPGRSDEGHTGEDMQSDEWFLENRPPHHG
ncbi:MAG: hypothetical protein C0482_27545 [Gordonia sp.]|jgi:hypothetical protein|nr:hypothetical protein [Gordonia sp. (in: high G+C Gram-positive bacteria)]